MCTQIVERIFIVLGSAACDIILIAVMYGRHCDASVQGRQREGVQLLTTRIMVMMRALRVDIGREEGVQLLTTRIMVVMRSLWVDRGRECSS